MNRVKVGIIGPGNIGTDLMFKIKRSAYLETGLMAGIAESKGIKRAASLGIPTSVDGVKPILHNEEIKIVFDCTGALPHLQHAPLLKEAGKIAIDLTPAAVGPYVVPCVNLDQHYNEQNINMVTCGGQATAPIVYAIQRAVGVKYAEVVSAIASKSAGPGTRQNIDEFTQTTAQALCKLAGVSASKAIIILNPAEPPILMTNTIYAQVEKDDQKLVLESIKDIVSQVQSYVPGYQLRVPPIIEEDKITTIVQVEGAGDYLPQYAGNLDIITAAAVAIGENMARKLMGMEATKN